MFWHAPFCFVIKSRVAFSKGCMPFRFSILRTVVTSTFSFAIAVKEVVRGLAMVEEQMYLFSMLRPTFRPCRTFLQTGLFSLDSSRLLTTVDFESTDWNFWTTWLNLNPLWSRDKLKLRICLEIIVLQNSGPSSNQLKLLFNALKNALFICLGQEMLNG